MPFHIFLSQSLSLLTGGLELWKIGKDLILILASLFTICLVFWKGKATKLFKLLLAVAALYGLIHILMWLANPDIYARSAMLGTLYNTRLLLFALLGMGVMLLVPKFAFSSLLKWVLGVSSIVAGLGIIQYFLPADILTHFGYSLERGARPAFFIDDHPDYIRIMATLREPNALGAYLIVPAAVLTAFLFRYSDRKKQWIIAGLLGLHVLAIFLTFSRSAWLAAALTVGLVVVWQHHGVILRSLKRWWPVLIGVVLAVGIVGYTQRHTHFFQQYVIHSNPQETVQDLDSNDYHALLVRQGLEGVAGKPLGHGPGTAGIVSIQNPDGGQLTENYYIQIAYEVGVVGLGLFVAINALLYVVIWRRRDVVAIILCASFWGYVVTNMLLHTWSNEAVAAQWWLLAGAAAASTAFYRQSNQGASSRRRIGYEK